MLSRAGLERAGTEDDATEEYSDAIATYLGLAVSRVPDYSCTTSTTSRTTGRDGTWCEPLWSTLEGLGGSQQLVQHRSDSRAEEVQEVVKAGS